MDDLLALVGLYYAYFPVIGAIVALATIMRMPKPRNRAEVWDVWLSQYMLFVVGLSFAFNFVYHTVFRDFSARQIGWDDSPFQVELGGASLGVALVGFLAVRGSDQLRLAALLAVTPFFWCAAIMHVISLVRMQNFSPANAGFILYLDILLPVIGFFLWFAARRARAVAASADIADSSAARRVSS